MIPASPDGVTGYSERPLRGWRVAASAKTQDRKPSRQSSRLIDPSERTADTPEEAGGTRGRTAR